MSEIREDIITGENVVIASKRGERPHDFKQNNKLSHNQKECPFCYGNEENTPPEILAVLDKHNKTEGNANWKIRVVPNKFAALNIEEELSKNRTGFYNKMAGVGAAEVLIESQVHDSTLSNHDVSHIEDILKVLRYRYNSLAKDERLKYIQIFKNFGGAAGASLEHPHWQIMATPLVPAVIKKEIIGAKDYYQEEGECVYCQMIDHELKQDKRVIEVNDDFVVFNPYASRYPFETWILPKEHHDNFGAITTSQTRNLAQVLKQTMKRLENGLQQPPYNLILHTASLIGETEYDYHWHIEILPRLSISAGFELGTGNFVNPTPPEIATETLVSVNLE
ncbi:galactose-1-phosphate uridylyltransferase [Halanaerocella petrolearia]